MKYLTTILILIAFLTLGQHSIGQTISKKTAIRIVKKDTLTEIKKIENAEFSIDSLTKLPCWTVDEKTDVETELKKLPKARQSGNIFLYADRIKVNANTGEIFSREKILIGKLHYAPRF